MLSHLPGALELARRTEEHMKGMVSPATLFEEMGFNYVGPIDGHDLESLTDTLENLRDLEGPQFLHIKTVKGKGFLPAEADQIGYHAITKLEKPSTTVSAATVSKPAVKSVAKKKILQCVRRLAMRYGRR
ncbi:hypothetical protein HSBAA_62820 [Vreelandella sulfidaeris]|uniref:Transketolase signature 1 domain-containing protein n=1 Tax=Vreelandella sulfidaeris TaxID=115553 RepID=A0A455UFC3_9GAMM|nr:hypothetical protein HSBAA_62820 [Halomonas sulfidaeris]